MKKQHYLLFITAFLSLTGIAKETLPAGFKEQKQQTLSFTENKGQFADQNYNPRPDVLFGGSDGQITFYITNTSISYQLYRVDKYKEVEDPKTKELRKEIEQQTIYRTDIKWLNANPNHFVKTDEALPGVTNYYLEQCPNGALNVKSYTGITLENIYNNINLHYYEKNGQLKYDYIVAPYADYKQIQLQVEGAKLDLQEDGSLLIETPLGKIQEQAPLVYQNGKQLKARYTINNNIISFEVENYNQNYELIIDPVTRLWGTYYGDTGANYSTSCATDASGNVYMAGETQISTGTVIATSGSHQSAYGGGTSDAFLVKFNSSGVRQWGTYYGVAGSDSGLSCATDASGNVYMAGYTSGSTGTVIATTGSHQSASGGGLSEAFLVKFNSSGVRQWGTYYGGSGGDVGFSCATDASGNVYMAGRTDSNTGTAIATTGSHQSAYGGGSYDVFLVKFNSSGVRQWGTYYGGTGYDESRSCTTDASGNVYMAGKTNSSNGTAIATTGSHQSTWGGNDDGFLVKFNSSGVRQWGTYYGGTGYDESRSCTADASGNIYMVGFTDNTTGTVIATSGSHQSTHGGIDDAFLVKFNGSGVRQWGTYYGGSGYERAWFCVTDATGNVYMSGYSSSSTGTVIATTGSHQSAHGGGADAILVKFNSSGLRLWGTYYGDTGTDSGWSCAIDATGNAYLAGETSSSTGTVIATTGSHQSSYGGGTNDAFLVKFADCNVFSQPSAISGASSVCTGAIQTYSVTNDPYATFYTWSLPGGWSGSSSTNTISGTAGTTGIFTVTANDACGSSPQQTLNVTVNPLPTITVNSGSICSGNSFTISPGGASTYTIQGGNAVVSPTANSSYTIVGTSSAGCVSASSATSTITVNTTPTITVNSGSICSGNSFTISPGGASTYTIQGGNFVVSPGISTSYTVVGTSSAGCVSASSATSNVVNETPTITVNSGSICSGSSFTISPGGASTYTIQGGNALVSPTANASYTVVGTSSAGCVSVNSATSNITVNTTPTITVNSGSICSGNSFTISPGGASTYTIQGGSAVVSPTTNASYTVVGTSSAGCVSASSATSDITVNATPTITVNSGSICSGNSFTISPGGASTYTVQGGNFVVSPGISTSYTVVGTSSAGCVSASSATSNVVNATPTITVNSGSICSGNSFTISPGGASTYTLQGGNFVVSPTANASYTVVGTSSAGCVSASSATSNITVNTTPTITVNSGSICSGNSFTISPGGASTYTIQGGNAVVSPTANASYTVVGTSSAGCVSASSATSNITVNTTPTISVNSGTICSGNSFTISPSGASTYTVQGGNFVVSPGISTSYTVVGTSSAGCVSANSATSNIINATPTITVNSGSICSGNSFTISPGGASTYTLQGGNFVVSPTANASYTVVGTSSAGCVSVNSATSNVTVNATPTITVNSGSTCSGNSFSISPGGASTYTIQGGSAVVSPTTNASYTVVGTSSAGCVSASSATSNITVNATPTISVNSGTICSGNSFTISPGGASTYTIQGGNFVVSPGISTSYTVVGASSAGCLSAGSATSNVNVNAIPTVSVNSGAICLGDSFTISPGGASTYTIQGGNAVVSPTANSSYTVVGTSSAGCVSASSATSNITVNATPTITVNSGSICSGNSFTISPGGASTYTVQGGNFVVSPGISTSYTVVGTSSAGCVSASSATSNITVNATPTISVNSGTICSGNSFTISPGGASTYTVQGGNFVVSPGISTSYTVVGTSSAGCVSANSATSNIINATPTISVNSGTICLGDSFTISPGGASTYTIQGGNTVVSPAASTSFTIIGTSIAGCVSASSATSIVNVNPLPTVGLLTSNTLICEGESATLTASGASNYTFNPGGLGASIVVNPAVTSDYTVSGTDANGCSNSATLTQGVSICAGLSAKANFDEGFLLYPNPTTGIVTIQSSALVQKKVEVYNSIGQTVFSSELQNAHCELNLSSLPNGIYFVKIGTVIRKIIKE